MKKGIITTAFVGAFFALTTIGCGEKFVPMTEEQMTAHVDSVVTAETATRVQAITDQCASGMQAAVDAKVEEMKAAAETASAQ